MFDFHTHILHRMDDGSEDIETSLEMLEKAYSRGTDVLALTSHCYPQTEEYLDSFLEARNHRYNELKKACEGKEIPELRLGAEVNICSAFASFERIHELCIEGTDYMLIEMPHIHWREWMIENIYNLTLKGIKPIIAHIDRYVNYPKHMLHLLDELRPVYQVNAEAFLSSARRRMVLDFFKKGRIHILGSDVHNGRVKRKNVLCDAYIKLEENFGEEYVGFIRDNGFNVLDNRPVSRRRNFPKTIRNKFFF